MQKVINAISKVTADLLSGIEKRSQNTGLKFAYRSIDDVYNGLAPALSRHKVVFLTESVNIISKELDLSKKKTVVLLKVRYAIRHEDEVVHVEAFGEAEDFGAKATAFAASSAFKQAVIQSFCIPTKDVLDDPDKDREEPPAPSPPPKKDPSLPAKAPSAAPPKAHTAPQKTPPKPQKYAFEEGEIEGLLISIQEHFSQVDLAEIDDFFKSIGARPLVERTPEDRAKAIVRLCSPEGIAKFEAYQMGKK